MADIVTGDEEVTPVQPHASRKEYTCPGCTGPIPPGTYHLVVVPPLAPDLRRHWHHGCWAKEARRRHGRKVHDSDSDQDTVTGP